jgi:hypothetical protein
LQAPRLNRAELLNLVDPDAELQDIQRHRGQGYPCARSGQARIACRAGAPFLHNLHRMGGCIDRESE